MSHQSTHVHKFGEKRDYSGTFICLCGKVKSWVELAPKSTLPITVPCKYKDQFETCLKYVVRSSRYGRKAGTCEYCKARIRSDYYKAKHKKNDTQ